MNYETAIHHYLVARHGRSAGRSYHLLSNSDRDALANEFGIEMARCIRRVANDPSWEWTPPPPKAA